MHHTLSHSIPTKYKPTQATNVYPEPFQSTTHSPNLSHPVPDYARPSRCTTSTLVNLRPSQTKPPVYPSLSQPNLKPPKTYRTLSHCIPACPKPTQTISAYQANPRPSQTNPKPTQTNPKPTQTIPAHQNQTISNHEHPPRTRGLITAWFGRTWTSTGTSTPSQPGSTSPCSVRFFFFLL